MKRNSRKRFERIRDYLSGNSLLDVGAAEGWVGFYVERETGMRVQLLDVVDLNQSGLSHNIYDGRDMPYPDKAFDTITLLLTLHHCSEPERVLTEAARVARKRIVVTESVYRSCAGKCLLTFMDRTFNRLRSDGRMPEALHFKTVPEWRRVFRNKSLTIETEAWLSRGWHQQKLFVLRPG